MNVKAFNLCRLSLWGLLAFLVATPSAWAQGPSASVAARFSGLVYDRATQTYNSVLTLINEGPTLYSPLTVTISPGSPSVTITGAVSNGSNSFSLSVPLAGGSLPLNQSQTVVIAFVDPTRTKFTPTVTAVTGGPAPTVAVPNVVGESQAAAQTAFTDAGLLLGAVTKQSSPAVPSGSVISESPSAGSEVAVGSAVSVVISTGPAVGLIPGNSDATVAASTVALQEPGTLNPAEVSVDPSGNYIQRTEMLVVFTNQATVAQANALITSVSGTVVSMYPGSTVVGVRIPDPGTLAAYSSVIATLSASPVVEYVVEAIFPATADLPGGYTTANPHLGALLAERTAAAWTVWMNLGGPQNANLPTVIIPDYFIGLPAIAGAFSVSTDLVGTPTCGNAAVPNHGWSVLSAMAGSFSGAAPLATGILPFSLNVNTVDLCSINFANFYNQLISLIAAAPGRIIFSTSLYGGGASNTTVGSAKVLAAQAAAWFNLLRGGNPGVSPVESRLWMYVLAGNNNGLAGASAPTNNEYYYAAVNGVNGFATPTNVTSVGATNWVYGAGGQPVSSGVANFTAPGGSLNAIGVNVWAFIDNGETTQYESGTSFATPQVAGLAAFLAGIDAQNLTLGQIDQRIRDTSAATGTIDAYAATLTLDTALTPNGAPNRMALLDVLHHGRFDEDDLAAIVSALTSHAGALDYSQYDLNGDGFTGGGAAHTASFDLDVSYVPGNSGSLYSTIQETIAGVPVSFNESQLSDEQILCYYAYSPLYTQTNQMWDERPTILAPIASACGLTLNQVQVTFGSLPAGWTGGNPTTLTSLASVVDPFNPMLNATEFAIQGDPGNICVGYTGSGEVGGPVFSSEVTRGAAVWSVDSVANPPNIHYPNRLPCSSFVAVYGRQLWINATSVNYTISIFVLGPVVWEDQSRLYSGTPQQNWTDGSVQYGSVSVSNFGNFEPAAAPVTPAPMATVQFVYVSSQ